MLANIKGEIDDNIIIVGDLYTPHTPMCQEAFNRRLPVGCFGSVRNPLVLINS